MATVQALSDKEWGFRTRLFASVGELAQRLGQPAPEAVAAREPVPTARSVADFEAMTVLAEAVARLSDQVDALGLRLAAVESATKRGTR